MGLWSSDGKAQTGRADMTEDSTSTYATIAEAEAAITGAGYIRDTQRHVWAKGNDSVKVVRTPDMRFRIEKASP